MISYMSKGGGGACGSVCFWLVWYYQDQTCLDLGNTATFPHEHELMEPDRRKFESSRSACRVIGIQIDGSCS
jgi:hypothetical protein